VIGSSQNARFEAPGLAGHHIAEAIAGGLAACGLDVTPPERWRGFGIRLGCRVAVVHLVLVSEWRASGVRWRWDGPARDEDTPYPRALSSIQATIAT
jgi:hypothetical protein